MALNDTAEQNPILKQAAPAPAVGPTTVPTTPTKAAAPIDAVETALAPSMQAVEESLASFKESSAENKAFIKSNVIKTEAITNDIEAAMKSSVASQQAIGLAKDTADLKAQDLTIEAISGSGAQAQQARLMQDLVADQDNLDSFLEKRQEILTKEYTGVGFLDGIIGEAIAPTLDSEIKVATAKYNQTALAINNLTSAGESVAKTNLLTRQTLTKGTIQANQELIASQAALELSETKLKGIQTNAEAMQRVADADAQDLAVRTTMYQTRSSLLNDVENRKLRVKEMEHRETQMKQDAERYASESDTREVQLKRNKLALAIEKATSPIELRKLERQEKDFIQADIDKVDWQENTVAAVQATQMAGTGSSETRGTILGNLSQTGDTSKKYQKLASIGHSLLASEESGEQSYGTDFADFSKNLTTIIAPSGNYVETKMTQLMEVMQAKQEVAEVTRAEEGTSFKNEEEKEAHLNLITALHLKEKEANIITGDSSNPYHGPPMSVLADKAAVKNSTFYKRVLREMQMQELNPQAIYDAAIPAIRAERVTLEEAAHGIVTIFKAAMHENNTKDGGFNRAALPDQDTYISTIKRLSSVAERSLELFGAPVKAALRPTKAVTGRLPPPTRASRVNQVDMVTVKQTLGLLLSRPFFEQELKATPTPGAN